LGENGAWAYKGTAQIFWPIGHPPGEHGEISGRLEVGWESDVLEHKSGNISETHKDSEKVTMEGL